MKGYWIIEYSQWIIEYSQWILKKIHEQCTNRRTIIEKSGIIPGVGIFSFFWKLGFVGV